MATVNIAPVDALVRTSMIKIAVALSVHRTGETLESLLGEAAIIVRRIYPSRAALEAIPGVQSELRQTIRNVNTDSSTLQKWQHKILRVCYVNVITGENAGHAHNIVVNRLHWFSPEGKAVLAYVYNLSKEEEHA